jgi:hypothetical protein
MSSGTRSTIRRNRELNLNTGLVHNAPLSVIPEGEIVEERIETELDYHEDPEF